MERKGQEGEVKGKEEWKESWNDGMERAGERRRQGEEKKRHTRGQEGNREQKRREEKLSMLLGNNLWSMKTSNMADLALLAFHFGECPLRLYSHHYL